MAFQPASASYGASVDACDTPGNLCFCQIAPPSPPPSPGPPPAPPAGSYGVFNFSVTENFATVATTFDAEASTSRFETYREVLTRELEALAADTRTVVTVAIGTPITPINGTIVPQTSPAVFDTPTVVRRRVRRKLQQESTCSEQYTPVRVSVQMVQPQSPEWVQSLVQQAGEAATNALGESVVQCADVATVLDAPLELIQASPPPPPSPPKPPPPPPSPTDTGREPNWSFLIWVLLIGVIFFGMVCCLLFGLTNDDREKYERNPPGRLGVLGLGKRVGKRVARAVGLGQAARKQAYLGLRLDGSLGQGLVE